MKGGAVKKWLTWVCILVLGTYLGGDFGLLMGLILIYLTR